MSRHGNVQPVSRLEERAIIYIYIPSLSQNRLTIKGI